MCKLELVLDIVVGASMNGRPATVNPEGLISIEYSDGIFFSTS